jgi:hypothetical protein
MNHNRNSTDRPDIANLKLAVRALRRSRKHLGYTPLAEADLSRLLDRLDKLIASTMRTLEMVVIECPQQGPYLVPRRKITAHPRTGDPVIRRQAVRNAGL